LCATDGATDLLELRRQERAALYDLSAHHPPPLVPADRTRATWTLDVDVVHTDGTLDFRGPAVQGRRGERFVYLTWGNVDADGGFEMFRRAKLMLDRIEPALVESALAHDGLRARVDLTGDGGGPRCARARRDAAHPLHRVGLAQPSVTEPSGPIVQCGLCATSQGCPSGSTKTPE